MKVMFVVYHDIRTEARSQEILECAKMLGNDTILVSYSIPFVTDGIRCVTTGSGQRRYFPFIIGAIRAIRRENPDVVILHDNYTSFILKWLKKYRKNIFVIYDSSELYIDGKPKSVKAWIARHMRYFEKKYLKLADVVIAANRERADIMRKYFQLKETPIIFDNMHRIDDDYEEETLRKKYCHLLSPDKFNILYAGGVAEKRLTYDLVRAVRNLGDEFRLIICGSASEADRRKLEEIIRIDNLEHIHYIGFVKRSELRYLLRSSHISVSAFAQTTLNNIYCASGKLYESLFEGTPVLVSENPPLKRLCSETGVGVSNNDFVHGIIELRDNYDYYKRNVAEYISTIDYEGRITLLAKKLKARLPRGYPDS